MAKPSTIPTWATGGGADVETPSAGKIALGYENGEVLSAGFLNWLHKRAGEWFSYLDNGLESLTGFAPNMVNGFGLVMTFDGGDANGRKAHLYVNDYGELFITYNAYWDGANSLWKPDVGATSDVANFRLIIGENQISVQYAPQAASWGELDWSAYVAIGDVVSGGGLTVPALVTAVNSRIKFTSTTTASGGSNPPATTAIANELRAKNTPKCWGSVHNVAGVSTSVSLIEGFNVASVTFVGTELLKVTFAQAMADANYAVMLTQRYSSDGSAPYHCRIYSKDATYFTVIFHKHDGSVVTLQPEAAASLDWDFLVFGKQTT